MLSRLVIIGYESGVLYFNNSTICYQEGDCKEAEANWIIVGCSWYRCYYFVCILTIMIWLSIEREFALFFIRDYETVPRIWISVGIIFVLTTFCAIISTLYTFPASLTIVPFVLAGAIAAAFGFYMYFHGYHRSVQILEELNTNGSSSKNHRYTLALRYQLEENVWCAKLMRNAFISLVSINLYTCAAFLLATTEASKSYFSIETIQFLDVLYNIFVVINGPIVAFVTLRNSYLGALCRQIFLGKGKAVPEVHPPSEGEVYFNNLQHQWDLGAKKTDKK